MPSDANPAQTSSNAVLDNFRVADNSLTTLSFACSGDAHGPRPTCPECELVDGRIFTEYKGLNLYAFSASVAF